MVFFWCLVCVRFVNSEGVLRGFTYIQSKLEKISYLHRFFSLNDYTNYFLSNSWLKGKDLQVFCNSYVHVLKFVAWISRHIWKITTSSNDRLFLTLKGSFHSSIYFPSLQQPVFYGHLSGHLKCLLSERDD